VSLIISYIFNRNCDCVRIKLTSVFANDHDKALKFYTETLGFVKKADIRAGK